jgi:hypothetical protein
VELGTGIGNGAGGAGRSDSLRERLADGNGVLGGLVTETGLAVVEEGEMVVARPGSQAAVQLARADVGTEVHIHLPVVVEVVGRGDDNELERTVDETLRRLRLAIEAQPREA